MKQIGKILPTNLNKLDTYKTVNSNKNNNITISTVNSYSEQIKKIEAFLINESIKPEAVAQMLAEGLDDIQYLNYYLLLVKHHDPAQLLEALHFTKDASLRNTIRTKKAIYFISILKHWGLKTKFRRET